ncbi:TfoX/Sxy family DNA transformation protein [Tatumella sp. TA1]|uniref:TfoX/Sxy family DNA transformation protein n=1 Tax=Rosenbergiella collisarenosi TaxID=1544695 RepID=UPI0008F81337|nr:TfoX/Sxy family DNA transformation protein [Rosenbergiella collisarenosi]MBT0722025.1 TfoX/Sxy family DNA transformation protein [Rosenbergiella collisarenosi]QGX91093.1 TfoX/Sxy family DNA transformation protein [Tatumella sp. TA1]
MNRSQQCIADFTNKVCSLGCIQSKTQFGGYSLSIDSVVFALVKQGEVYLRGSEVMSQYLSQHTLNPFIFSKRGSAIALNYFSVSEQLWQDEISLLKLSRAALQDAKNCRVYKQAHRRLKDLPNLGIRFETLLREVGIHTEEQLRNAGVQQCWTLMYQRNKHLGLPTLFYLQGAIMGIHHAVLPQSVRHELIRWHSAFTASRSIPTLTHPTVLTVAV